MIVRDYDPTIDGEKLVSKVYRVGEETQQGEVKEIKVDSGKHVEIIIRNNIKLMYPWNRVVKCANKFVSSRI